MGQGNRKVEEGQRWLKQYLALPHGIPSHNTFGRVFARLDPEQCEASFLSWVQAVFENVDYDYAKTVNSGHGRVETRECWTISGEESLDFLRGYSNWQGLQTIAMVKRQRQMKEKEEVTTETHYYISSLPNDAESLLQAAATGALRIPCTGSWMSPWAKMTAVCARTMRRKNWACSATWP